MYVKQIAVLRRGEVAKAANMAEGLRFAPLFLYSPKKRE